MKASSILSGVLMLSLAACAGEREEAGSANDLEGPDTAEAEDDLTSGRVALRVPLIDDEGRLLSEHNTTLGSAGLDTFPDVVELEGDARGKAVADTDKKWRDATALVDKAFEQLKLAIPMHKPGEPYHYKTSAAASTICYKGNPKLVAALVDSLGDKVFAYGLTIQGWRYRKIKTLGEGFTPDDEEAFPSLWHEWRGRGAAVLVLTLVEDGDDANAAIIPKCR